MGERLSHRHFILFLVASSLLDFVDAGPRRRGGVFVFVSGDYGSLPWWGWILTGISILSIIYGIYRCCSSCKEESGIPSEYCPLCCEDKPLLLRTNEGLNPHRSLCLEDKKEYLEHHPEQPQLSSKCPTCGGHLRKWTSFRKKNKDETSHFYCSVHDPENREPIINTDDNRYTCFGCYYNLCSVCLERSELQSWHRPQVPKIVVT